jgi:hypothetical protein
MGKRAVVHGHYAKKVRVATSYVTTRCHDLYMALNFCARLTAIAGPANLGRWGRVGLR